MGWAAGNNANRLTGTELLLLFVDQWEELYTSCKQSRRRERFVQELLDATADPGSRLSVVFTLRGDFAHEILEDRPLLDRLHGAELKLGPMNRDELRSTIAGPAENVGLQFQEGLIERILQDAGDEPGSQNKSRVRSLKSCGRISWLVRNLRCAESNTGEMPTNCCFQP